MTECFLGLLVLVWGAVLASAGDLESYLDVITNPTHFCSAVCQKNGVSCLPHWTHPTEMHPHCERQQEDLCIMCLNLVGIFPGKVSCQNKPNQTPTCTGPCSNVCSFKDMCMPATFDPNRHYHPHCTGDNDKNYPSHVCIYCLIDHGVNMPDKPPGIGVMPTVSITVRPKPSTTVQIQTPPPATFPPTRPTRPPTFPPTYPPTYPPTQPSTPVTYPTTTTATPVTYPTKPPPNCSRPPGASTDDPCLKFCDHYMQVCMPPELDPCFFYYPHCDTYVEGYRPASAKCLQCINIHGLRPNPPAIQTSPPPIYTPPPTIYTPPPTTTTTPATTTTTPATTTSAQIVLPWDCFCTRVQTTIAEAKTSKCPGSGYGCLILANQGITTEDWSCSCGSRRSAEQNNNALSFPRGLFDNCLLIFSGNCVCRRTSVTTRRGRINSCADFRNNHWRCKLNDASATEDTVVHNYCSCNGCNFSLLPILSSITS